MRVGVERVFVIFRFEIFKIFCCVSVGELRVFSCAIGATVRYKPFVRVMEENSFIIANA